MALCGNCGKQFEASGLRKLFSTPTMCPECKADRDKKIQRYLEAVKYFGKDKYLTKDENSTLQELKLNLGLTEDEVKSANKELEKLRSLTSEKNIEICNQKVADICSKGQISQEDETELAEILSSFGISELNLPENTRQDLIDVRMLTVLAHGALPILQADILLKQGEMCHFATSAQLLEESTKTRYVGGSSGVSFRIVKGVTFRTGSFKGTPIRESYKKITDSGVLYVTNKKVTFIGNRKNATYPINKIIHITKYSDGIQFQKENESKMRIFLIGRPSHIDAIGTIVSRLIQG